MIFRAQGFWSNKEDKCEIWILGYEEEEYVTWGLGFL